MDKLSLWREKDLFNYLKETTKDLRLMEDTYSRWDCITDEDKEVIELKCRRTHYPTLLIEKKKFDAIVEKAKEVGYRPVYINTTPKGIYKWYLDEEEIEWKVEHRHPATTAFGNRTRVAKEVGYLEVNKGNKIYEN